MPSNGPMPWLLTRLPCLKLLHIGLISDPERQNRPLQNIGDGDGGQVSKQGKTDIQVVWLLQQGIRGKRKKQDLDDIIPSILEPEGSSKAFRKNWAHLFK